MTARFGSLLSLKYFKHLNQQHHLSTTMAYLSAEQKTELARIAVRTLELSIFLSFSLSPLGSRQCSIVVVVTHHEL